MIWSEMRPALNKAKQILSNNKCVTGVEVGVLRGENAREIMREWLEVNTLYLVDNYKNNEKEYNTALEILRGWENRLEWIIDDSVQAAQTLYDLDFAYIDGDHSYNGVKRDIEAYWPKIKKGGVLCGHDYQKRWTSLEGCVRAVEEHGKKYGLILWSDTSGSSSDWLYVKP